MIASLTFKAVLFVLACCQGAALAGGQEHTPMQRPLFSGNLAEWDGDWKQTWRIENGAITAGSLQQAVPRNEFICTRTRYSDFELTLRFKITGEEKINAGVQFRTERIPNHHEVRGYQADIGPGYHGALYDESRRNKLLAAPDKVTEQKALAAIPEDGWQTYRIRAIGDRIQLWLNGIQTVDYIEPDNSIARDGIIALQIHGGMRGIIAYDQIFIADLSGPDAKSKATIDQLAWIHGHWTGTAMGGTFEETWNPPLAGEMVGMFKFVKENKVEFYELLTIVPHNDSFLLRLKHFDDQFVGWEEKDKCLEFPLVSVTENEIRFDGLVFKKISDQEIVIEVVAEQLGEQNALRFECHRAE